MTSDGPVGTTGQRRDIDPQVGVLEGVGSRMRIEPGTRAHGDELAGPSPYDVWHRKPSADGRAAATGDVTYFDRPVLKEPVWIWSVPAYFYVGGLAGAAALLAAVARSDDELVGLVDRCRWMAALGTTVGTGLLIEDLGRPKRFLNMLRVFRPTSPMSVGSWVLAASAGLGSAAVAARLLRSRLDGHGSRRIFGLVEDGTTIGAGLLGPPLAGYTGVLVANTAVPAWQCARRSLPPLFMASAVLAAASALDLMDLNDEESRVVRNFGIVGALGELLLGKFVEKQADREQVGEPYHDGASGAMWRLAKAATATSLALRLLPGSSRLNRAVAGVAGTMGTVSLRFAVFHAGTRSARDPRATFRHQRAGHGAAQVTDRPAVVGAGNRRALPEPTR
ncbi:MAG: polysulfide reductase NrfD [Actinobacteria bacterium]|nr:polysulfide reductase NrfD [Actinomycetota bacterium]